MLVADLWRAYAALGRAHRRRRRVVALRAAGVPVGIFAGFVVYFGSANRSITRAT